jgi:hypothetical protein
VDVLNVRPCNMHVGASVVALLVQSYPATWRQLLLHACLAGLYIVPARSLATHLVEIMKITVVGPVCDCESSCAGYDRKCSHTPWLIL